MHVPADVLTLRKCAISKGAILPSSPQNLCCIRDLYRIDTSGDIGSESANAQRLFAVVLCVIFKKS